MTELASQIRSDERDHVPYRSLTIIHQDVVILVVIDRDRPVRVFTELFLADDVRRGVDIYRNWFNSLWLSHQLRICQFSLIFSESSSLIFQGIVSRIGLLDSSSFKVGEDVSLRLVVDFESRADPWDDPSLHDPFSGSKHAFVVIEIR